jgi:hypothetical protein
MLTGLSKGDSAPIGMDMASGCSGSLDAGLTAVQQSCICNLQHRLGDQEVVAPLPRGVVFMGSVLKEAGFLIMDILS